MAAAKFTSRDDKQAYKAGESELKCIICKEDFSDDKVPRNLGCGHSVCTLCINQYFLNNRDQYCPECRQPFYVRSASDLPVNYPILKLIRSIGSSGSELQGGSPTALSSSKTQGDNNVVIDEDSSGPFWRESPTEFNCLISTPKKQAEFFGMKNYIAYTVTPSFSSKHVLRRYKQFDYIHEQLKIIFPLIVLPSLPEKQLLGKFTDDLIEYRKGMLQAWIDRICRHPVLSQSDVFRLFITVSNEKLWKSDSRKLKNDTLMHRNFFSNLELPQSKLDVHQIDKRLEGYAHFVDILEKSVKELQHACMLQANHYETDFKQRYFEISQAFMKFSQAFDTDATSGASEVSYISLHISEAFLSTSVIQVEELRHEWLSLHNLLTDYQVYISELSKILSVARTFTKKAFNLELAESYPDAVAASYVFQAEAAHLKKQLVRDIKRVIKGILVKQLDSFQLITNQLRACMEKAIEEGKIDPSEVKTESLEVTMEPTAPPLDLCS